MTKTIKNPQQALLVKLQALYDVELALEKALPKMIKAASDKTLKEGFVMHLKETKEHARRLETIFDILGVKAQKEKSEGIRGIIKDAEWVIKTVKTKGPVKDAVLSSGARYVEHYEIAGYLSAFEAARFFGLNEIAEILHQTLIEEAAADRKLEIAYGSCLQASA